jgi:hypothetical protein
LRGRACGDGFRSDAIDWQPTGSADFQRFQHAPGDGIHQHQLCFLVHGDTGRRLRSGGLRHSIRSAVAANVQSGQDAANRLQAYVDEQSTNNAAANKTDAPVSLQSILDTVAQSTDTPPASAQPTTGSNVEAIVAQIKTVADANEPPPFQSFVPSKSLSNSVTVDGYTLTVDTNASTQFYGVSITGNGAQYVDKHFGSEDEAGGELGEPPAGVLIGDQFSPTNNDADSVYTITQNLATASSASTSSSSTGSTSTSSVNAQSRFIRSIVQRHVIDFGHAFIVGDQC